MKLTVPKVLSKVLAGCVLGLFIQGQAGAQAVSAQSAPTQAGSAAVVAVELMPSWFEAGRPTADVAVALEVLADAAAQGLNPADYRAQELIQAFDGAGSVGAAPEVMSRLDTELTAALELYLADLQHGRLSPETLKHRFKAPTSERFDARRHVIQARQAGLLAAGLRLAQPQVPMYEAVRRAMEAYRAMGDHAAWQRAFPPLATRSLKPGQTWEGLPLVAERLAALGDLTPGSMVVEHYDEILVEGVRRFQERHGLEPDGVLGPATLEALNVTPAQRVKQMALTLERLRWTPLLHGPRMIVVNVPEFVLRAYERKAGAEVELNLEMRVVVGRALDTRTPIFLEDMRFIEFSPYWNVPISIARGETLPRLRRDPGYFSQQGFEFVSRDGTVTTALSDTAIDAVQRGEWRVRQRPGPRNALGDIKFIFPNDQNIYLHHTPAPQLFARARRDFSHGCIRIEYPVKLAEFVLKHSPEWTTERIEAAMSGGRSRTLRLQEPIPVLISYSTVVVKNDKVYFFPDIYQQDALLEQALNKARPLRS